MGPKDEAALSVRVAQDLRDLASLAEVDEFAAAIIRRAIGAAFPAHAEDDPEISRKSSMAKAIRAFKGTGAAVTKAYSGRYFDATVRLRALTLILTDERDAVCERVVTGTMEVVEEVPDPEYIAAAPKVSRKKVEEIVEWRCAPILSLGE